MTITADITKSSGTMFLPSNTAIALWNAELLGQLSDGMWENSSPAAHWRFWHAMHVVAGSPASIVLNSSRDISLQCRKSSYNFAGLYEIVGDRMLAYGRMAKSGADPWNTELLVAGEFMPETFKLFLEEREIFEHSDNVASRCYTNQCVGRVAPELAENFYKTFYTMKEMRSDIKLIKSTMKMVKA